VAEVSERHKFRDALIRVILYLAAFLVLGWLTVSYWKPFVMPSSEKPPYSVGGAFLVAENANDGDTATLIWNVEDSPPDNGPLLQQLDLLGNFEFRPTLGSPSRRTYYLIVAGTLPSSNEAVSGCRTASAPGSVSADFSEITERDSLPAGVKPMFYEGNRAYKIDMDGIDWDPSKLASVAVECSFGEVSPWTSDSPDYYLDLPVLSISAPYDGAHRRLLSRDYCVGANYHRIPDQASP
jgi:hypothetical protein